MTSISDPAAWPVFIGTARGSAHESRHLPNQDSAGSRPVTPAGGVVLAVADGHGAARHFRSSTGSLLAIRAALAAVEGLAGEITGPWRAAAAAGVSAELPAAIVARWRHLVAEHLASHPYSPDEAAALELAHDGPEIPYGSTLLLALIVTDWLVCAQIGDGDMLAVRPDGGSWIPVGGDDRLDGFRTTSLCQSGAVGSFRTAAHDLRAEPLLALQLSTDGYGNAQATDPWQPAVAADLASLAAGHDHHWFEEQVPLWAQRCASAQGSGDDTTIALLLAPDSARLAAAAASPAASPAAASPAAASPPAAQTAQTASPQPHSSQSRRRTAVAGIAAVIVAAAITIGLLASQSSSGPAPAPRSTGQPKPKATPSAADPGVQPRSTAAVPAGTTASAQPAGVPASRSPGAQRASNGTPRETRADQSNGNQES